jgi:hypothetical protein
MGHAEQISVIPIVAAVVLFFLLGIAIMVLIDNKARMPGDLTGDPFTIRGLRRDHPVLAVLVGGLLLLFIGTLAAAVLMAVLGNVASIGKEEQPRLLSQLREGRRVESERHFHILPKDIPQLRGEKNVCFFCHGDYPHSKTPMVRSLLNMHTQFFGCMTCHIDTDQVPIETLAFRWLNYSGIKTKGPRFGTAIDPDTGYLQQTDDYYSKIVVYSVRGGREELLELTPDQLPVKEFAQIHGQLSDQDREAVKERFHKRIKHKGPECDTCHTEEEESRIPLRQLGFSERRIEDVTSMNIVGVVKKYKTFYFPSLRPEPEAGEGRSGQREVTGE